MPQKHFTLPITEHSFVVPAMFQLSVFIPALPAAFKTLEDRWTYMRTFCEHVQRHGGGARGSLKALFRSGRLLTTVTVSEHRAVKRTRDAGFGCQEIKSS